MPVYYEVGDEVEILYKGWWQYGAFVTKVDVRRQLKRKKDCLYTVSAADWHEIRHVPSRDLRSPTRYPTRKAVWSIQYLKSTREISPRRGLLSNNEKDMPRWMAHHTSFDSFRLWNHTLDWVLHAVRSNYDAFRSQPDMFRIYNHQSKEIIPIAGLTHE